MKLRETNRFHVVRLPGIILFGQLAFLSLGPFHCRSGPPEQGIKGCFLLLFS